MRRLICRPSKRGMPPLPVSEAGKYRYPEPFLHSDVLLHHHCSDINWGEAEIFLPYPPRLAEEERLQIHSGKSRLSGITSQLSSTGEEGKRTLRTEERLYALLSPFLFGAVEL